MDASSVRRNLIMGSDSLELSSPVAELIANNVDLLTQILMCFPAISLIRFKSVSKHWLSLISDTQFAVNHSRRNPTPSASGLFLRWKYKSTENTKSVSLQGHPNRPTLAFLDGYGVAECRPRNSHSCNGLLLCQYPDKFRHRYIVCNPTTKTYTAIPNPPGFLSCGVPRTLCAFLAFDPSKSPHYKVVFMGIYSQVVNIYCSENASWKQIRVPVPSFICATFCSGVIYWLSCEELECIVLGFDVYSEKMIEMEKPLEFDSTKKIKYFGECGGV